MRSGAERGVLAECHPSAPNNDKRQAATGNRQQSVPLPLPPSTTLDPVTAADDWDPTPTQQGHRRVWSRVKIACCGVKPCEDRVLRCEAVRRTQARRDAAWHVQRQAANTVERRRDRHRTSCSAKGTHDADGSSGHRCQRAAAGGSVRSCWRQAAAGGSVRSRWRWQRQAATAPTVAGCRLSLFGALGWHSGMTLRQYAALRSAPHDTPPHSAARVSPGILLRL